MIRECRQHGFFRDDKCPVCNSKGKFIMNDREINAVGKIMAGILRHFPHKFGLKMTDMGWVNIYEFIDAIKHRSKRFRWLRPRHIEAIVYTDPKGRYQIRGNAIRATYGHTVDVELDLPTDDIPDTLYYPASREEVDIILETGIKPVDRKKVHLSKTIDAAKIAGLHRVNHPVIIAVDAKRAIADGVVIKHAAKTVYVIDSVAPTYLSKLE